MKTPNDLNVVLHLYTSPTKHPRQSSNAVIESIERYVQDGILKETSIHESGYVITPKGTAWILSLLKTPYPQKAWVDDKDSILVRENE